MEARGRAHSEGWRMSVVHPQPSKLVADWTGAALRRMEAWSPRLTARCLAGIFEQFGPEVVVPRDVLMAAVLTHPDYRRRGTEGHAWKVARSGLQFLRQFGLIETEGHVIRITERSRWHGQEGI